MTAGLAVIFLLVGYYKTADVMCNLFLKSDSLKDMSDFTYLKPVRSAWHLGVSDMLHL